MLSVVHVDFCWMFLYKGKSSSERAPLCAIKAFPCCTMLFTVHLACMMCLLLLGHKHRWVSVGGDHECMSVTKPIDNNNKVDNIYV